MKPRLYGTAQFVSLESSPVSIGGHRRLRDRRTCDQNGRPRSRSIELGRWAPVASYRFLFLGEHREAVGLDIQNCKDDLDALDAAQKLCKKNGVEVWDGSRLVAYVSPDDQEQGRLQL